MFTLAVSGNINCHYLENLVKAAGILLALYLISFGVIRLYEYSIDNTKMKTIAGTLKEKRFIKINGTRAVSYYVSYTLRESDEKIRMEINSAIYSEGNLNFDSSKVGNYYTFYLNPAIPGQNAQNNDIRSIDHNGKPIFVLNVRHYLVQGVLSIICALVLSLFMYGYYRRAHG